MGFLWDVLSFLLGRSKVVLTDRGSEDQVLLGDAMKWVYVGDK